MQIQTLTTNMMETYRAQNVIMGTALPKIIVLTVIRTLTTSHDIR